MTNVPVCSLLLAGFFALQAETASAWSCVFPELFVVPIDEPLPSEEELLRLRSIELSKFVRVRQDADLVVYGRFFKNDPSPFLHEGQLENIRALYWPPSKTTQMPAQIEYTYFDAYRFEGHQIMNGELIPFADEGIDIRISIFAEYEGIADALPPTSEDVIGVLLPSRGLNRLEIEASACPTYIPIEASQLADLLTCIKSGECG
jgi:hypothetical protein